jgi:hypothetical protein
MTWRAISARPLEMASDGLADDKPLWDVVQGAPPGGKGKGKKGAKPSQVSLEDSIFGESERASLQVGSAKRGCADVVSLAK